MQHILGILNLQIANLDNIFGPLRREKGKCESQDADSHQKYPDNYQSIFPAHGLHYQRLMREIFVPSMLTLSIRPCWSKMKA